MSVTISVPFSAIADEIEEEMSRKYRAFMLTIFNNVNQLSPVDTGRYRSNHVVSVGKPNFAYSEGKGGFRGETVITNIKDGKLPTVYFQNNLPYAEVIENGHSGQAPTGVYQNAANSAVASFG